MTFASIAQCGFHELLGKGISYVFYLFFAFSKVLRDEKTNIYKRNTEVLYGAALALNP